MEIGNEISQKIRSAIKAKLLDLGAYVDDELPDYIMVMVANKKTKAQMTEDLNLFLGTHTDKFTLWLHGLLCKLQSITAEMTPGEASEESQAEKAAKDKNILDEETWAVTKGGGGGEQAVKKGEPFSVPVSTGQAKGQSKQVTQKVTETPAIAEEPEINLRPEHDEFEEEVQAEMEKQKKEAKVTQHRKRVSSNTEKGSSTTESAVSKEKSSGSHISPKRRRHSKEQPEKVTGRVTPRRRQSSKDTEPKSGKEEKVSGSSHHGKKKRPLPSSVGAVIKHEVYASDDEYDPLNPAVGSVASVVKVTERKSSIPADMQPNKSLLLKAMEAAHKSIEKLASKAIVKPTARESQEVTEEEQGKETKKEQKEMEVEETRSVSIKSRLGARHKPSISESLREERKVQLVTRSSRESSRRIMSRKSSGDSEEGSKSKRRKDHTSDGGSLRLTDDVEQTDSRQVEIIVTRNVKQGSSRHAGSETQKEGSEEEDLIKILMEGAAEESDFTDAGEDVGRRMEAGIVDGIQEDSVRQSSQSEPVEKMVDPRFVVTLDGIDGGVAMEKEEVIEDTRHVSPAKNVVMVKPQRATVDPVLINLSEDNDEEPQSGVTPGVSSPEVQKVQEKCRFWPACKTGEQCPYVHPTTQCLKFPNCHFGERCVYVHPVCKFDSQCTRPGCPYTHSSKRSAFQPPTSIVLQPVRVPLFTPRPPVPAPVIQRAGNAKEMNCKFFPNCTNMECTFRHPKPCRFGIGCAQKSSCYFFHPNLPSKGQLKWSAQASKKLEPTSQRSTSSLTSP